MIEVACPKCGGRLTAEPEALVACPHCKELLQIPTPQAAAESRAGADSSLTRARGPHATPLEGTGEQTDDEPSFPGLPLAETVSVDSFLRAATAAGGTAPDTPHTELETQAASAPPEEAPRPTLTWAPAHDEGFGLALREAKNEAGNARDSGPPGEAIPGHGTADPHAAEVQTVAASRASPVSAASPPVAGPVEPPASVTRRPAGIPSLYFVAVCSYALLATLVVIVLLTLRLRPHQLESLPDIVPRQDARGDIQIPLYPEDARLPRGHELRLGDVARFGNVQVQPLRVTRGPIEFVHFQGEPPDLNGFDGDGLGQNGFERESTPPVLKLWLRFRNVSPDQTFAPLGKALVFTRGRGKSDRRRRGNNFVCPSDADARPAGCVYVFDHVVSGEYDLRDQHVDRGLAPGDELTTYIPSEEDGPDRLAGELVWRVHFRKGLGPSGWGVTTLADVLFHRDEVLDEGEELAGE